MCNVALVKGSKYVFVSSLLVHFSYEAQVCSQIIWGFEKKHFELSFMLVGTVYVDITSELSIDIILIIVYAKKSTHTHTPNAQYPALM